MSILISSVCHNIKCSFAVFLKLYITEDLVSACSMHGTTENTCSWECRQLCNALVTLSGIQKKIAGVRKALVRQIRTNLEDLPLQDALFIYCNIPHQALCGKTFMAC